MFFFPSFFASVCMSTCEASSATWLDMCFGFSLYSDLSEEYNTGVYDCCGFLITHTVAHHMYLVDVRSSILFIYLFCPCCCQHWFWWIQCVDTRSALTAHQSIAVTCSQHPWAWPSVKTCQGNDRSKFLISCTSDFLSLSGQTFSFLTQSHSKHFFIRNSTNSSGTLGAFETEPVTLVLFGLC